MVSRRRFAPVAQGIEHRIPNPGVACSNHAGGTSKFKGLWLDQSWPLFLFGYVLVTPFGAVENESSSFCRGQRDGVVYSFYHGPYELPAPL